MRLLRLLAATAFLTAPLLLTSPAHASPGTPTDCTTQVDDDAHVLDAKKVAAAIATFPDTVTVHVSTYANVSGDLFDTMRADAAACDGWGYATKGPDASLLMVAVAPTARQQGGYFDGAHQSRFLNVRTEVEQDEMGPRFKNAQWTAGIVAGLRVYQAAYEQTVDTDASDPGTQSTDASVSPPDTGAILLVLSVIAAAIGLIGGVIGSVIGIRKYRDHRRDRASARSDAAAAREKAGALFLDLEQAHTDALDTFALLPESTDPAATALRDRYQHVVSTYDAAVAVHMDVYGKHETTRLARYDLDHAREAVHDLKQLDSTLADAVAAFAELKQATETYSATPARVQATDEKVADELSAIATAIDIVAGQGFTMSDYQSQAAKIADDRATLETQLGAGAYSAAEVLAQDALSAAVSLHAAVEGLPARQATLRAALEAHTRRHDDVSATTDLTIAELRRLEDAYDATCVSDLTDNEDQALIGARSVPALLATLDAASSMDQQRFDDAEKAALAAQADLEQFDAWSAAVNQRKEALEKVRACLGPKFDAIEASVESVREEMAKHPEAMTFLRETALFDDWKSALTELREDFQKRRPALIGLEARADVVATEVASFTAGVARSIKEHRKAKAKLRDAEAAVQRAKSRVHGSSGSARSSLNDAEEALRRGQSALTLAAVLAAASAAQDAASAAVRAQETYDTSNSHSSNGYGSGGSSSYGGGFGGSSSFGGGFGGSSSFGGGSGGSSSF